MSLTDICLNLSNSQFKSDADEVLQRAQIAGVSRMIIVGTDIESSRYCASRADDHEHLFATAGVHPHDADNVPEHWVDEIRDVIDETELLLAQKKRLENAMRATEIPLHIATYNLNCRQRRENIECLLYRTNTYTNYRYPRTTSNN